MLNVKRKIFIFVTTDFADYAEKFATEILRDTIHEPRLTNYSREKAQKKLLRNIYHEMHEVERSMAGKGTEGTKNGKSATECTENSEKNQRQIDAD